MEAQLRKQAPLAQSKENKMLVENKLFKFCVRLLTAIYTALCLVYVCWDWQDCAS